MANISSLFFVCSFIAFAGVIFGAQAESSHFTFPPTTNLSLKVISTYAHDTFLNVSYMQLSNGDITQETFSWITYNQSISLWDDNSDFPANFSSHFQFITSKNDAHSSQYGDGLAFFLAPFEYEPPLNCTRKWLGLFNQPSDGNSSNQIVAVEFDTLKNNPFDPDDNHVGIDVNSIVSKAYVSLWNKMGIEISSGNTLDAWVDYDGLTKKLHVFLAAYSVGLQKPETPILSYDIDLTKFLPQKIKVGIPASAAYSSEQHDVFFWEFKSQMLTTPTNKKYVLILVFACVFTVAGIALLAGLCYFRNKSRRQEDIEMDKSFSEGTRKFSHAELSAAIKYFSQEQKLGRGGSGDVYRGILPGAKEVMGCNI